MAMSFPGNCWKRAGDWNCPNPDCMNHRSMVFGSKTSCPICAAPRPDLGSWQGSTTPQGQSASASQGQGSSASSWNGQPSTAPSMNNMPPNGRIFSNNEITGAAWGQVQSQAWNQGQAQGQQNWGQAQGAWGQASPQAWPPQTVGWMPPGSAPRVSFGNTDHLTRLIKTAAPAQLLIPEVHLNPAQSIQQCMQNGADWFCGCGDINHRTRRSCNKCGKLREFDFSAKANMSWEELCKVAREKGGSRSRSRSSSSSRSRKKAKSKKKKRRKSSSSSASSSSGAKRNKKGSFANGPPVDLVDIDDAPAKVDNPAHDKAKHEALQKIIELRDADLAIDERRRQWRALLREWHPDKHDDKELATAVFQFLQKAKGMIITDAK